MATGLSHDSGNHAVLANVRSFDMRVPQVRAVLFGDNLGSNALHATRCCSQL